MKKILLIIFDGLGDREDDSLSGKTPLEAANKPNLDFLAENGEVGLLQPLPSNVYPTSEEAHLAIFGYDWRADYHG
jgi:2,3-bisphosphoglycerate-independent phosphoglycerate mutase